MLISQSGSSVYPCRLPSFYIFHCQYVTIFTTEYQFNLELNIM